MKKIISLFLILLFATSGYSYVFINSLPMKAQVYLDGKHLGTTPVLIKEKIKGEHTLRYILDGYYTLESTIKLSGEVTNITTILSPQAFSIYVPGTANVKVNDKVYQNEQIQNLPEGFYYFKPGSNYVSIDRQNPNKKLLYVSLISTGIGLVSGISGLILGDQAYERYKTATNVESVMQSLNEAKFWDAAAIFGFTLTGIGTGATVYFWIDDVKFQKENKQIKIKTAPGATVEEEYYEKALDAMGNDNRTLALEYFDKLIKNQPNSRYFPIALYRQAGILSKMKKYHDALRSLERVVKDYPIYEIYELTLKLQGDNYRAISDYKKAVNAYNEINSINKTYSRQAVDLIIIQTHYEEYTKTKSEDTKLILSKLIKDYLANPAYSEVNKKTIKDISLN